MQENLWLHADEEGAMLDSASGKSPLLKSFLQRVTEEDVARLGAGSCQELREPLERGDIRVACHELGELARRLVSMETADLAITFCEFFRDIEDGSVDVLDRHFLYATEGQAHYLVRDEGPEHVRRAFEAFKRQIDLAPEAAREFLADAPHRGLPTHDGYRQLAVMYDRDGQPEVAMHLYMMAQKQGWWGERPDEITKRIERYRKKAESKRSK